MDDFVQFGGLRSCLSAPAGVRTRLEGIPGETPC